MSGLRVPPRFDVFSRLEEHNRRRDAEIREVTRKEQQVRDEARKKSIQRTAEACALVPEFPCHAIVDFMREYSIPQDFQYVRALNRSLLIPWDAFCGTITVGIIEQPNIGGFHTEGDFQSDFTDISLAHGRCANATVLHLREFGFRERNEALLPEFTNLGFEDSHLSYHIPIMGSAQKESIALFGNVRIPGALPTIPFEHLTVLRLEGDVQMQQFTLSSDVLREISIKKNRNIKAVGFLGLPQLLTIKLKQCPLLKDFRMAGKLLTTVSSIHITACQCIDLLSTWEVIDKLSSLHRFKWSDMLHQHLDGADFSSRLEFFNKISRKVHYLEVERFSLYTRFVRVNDLQPMETVFDEALMHTLEECASLNTLSIRGSGVFSALPIWHNTKVHCIDASSCKYLQKVVIYKESGLDEESLIGSNASLQKLVLNNCPRLETPPQSLTAFQSLRHLSLQDCPKVTNDLILNGLPPKLEHLDLSGCKNIGNFDSQLVFSVWNENLKWCSFKSTSICAADVLIWMPACPSLKYLNLSRLRLQGLDLLGNELETLLMLNVDISSPFCLDCPKLTELWIGNSYRGWPIENERHSLDFKRTSLCTDIDGKSLADAVTAACFFSDGKHLRIYLSEEFSIVDDGKTKASFTAEDFWSPEVIIEGAIYAYSRWNNEKATSVSSEVIDCLTCIAPSLASQTFTITIPEGPNPKRLCGPHYKPPPPDAEWHKDYSQVGLGHDGGYASQCEWDWY